MIYMIKCLAVELYRIFFIFLNQKSGVYSNKFRNCIAIQNIKQVRKWW